MNKLIVSTIALSFLSACSTTYSYTPPPDAEGKACIQKCQERKNACDNAEFERARNEYNQCEQRAANEYNQCEHDATIAENACLRSASIPSSCYREVCIKTPCYENADTSYCFNEFNSCYQQCGGNVEVVE